MDINERIKNISEYFTAFNVHEGVAYVLVNFPDKWTLFDPEAIGEEFGITITKRDNGTFFMCDVEQGFDCLFDAIDFIVENNQALEEKSNLLRQKVQELSTLFETEPLEKLKMLTFTFVGDEKQVEPEEQFEIPVDIKANLKKKKNEKKGKQERPKTEVTAVTDPVVKEVKVDNEAKSEGTLVDFAKSLVDNE